MTNRSNGELSALVDAAGPAASAHLRAIASAASDERLQRVFDTLLGVDRDGDASASASADADLREPVQLRKTASGDGGGVSLFSHGMGLH